MAKIIIGCPTYNGKSYCLSQYAGHLRQLTYPGISFLLVDNSPTKEYMGKIQREGLPVINIPHVPDPRDRVTMSRNILREKTLLGGYDYFLSLEQDILPEPAIIEKMLAHGKEIVAAPYCVYHVLGGQQVLVPLVYVQHPHDSNGLWYIPKTELQKPQLISVMGFGLGCVLIHRTVLEKITFRHANGYDDMMFCKDARSLGYELFVDTSLRITHVLPAP